MSSKRPPLVEAPSPAPEDMRWIPGGTFSMGSDRHYPEEAPAHPVQMDGFFMDVMPVTNAAFARFVAATGYVTLAERPIDPSDYPGVPLEALVPGSAVFHMTAGPVDLTQPNNWWRFVPGASWRAPSGPGSWLQGLEQHPVLHLAHEDARAYAEWAQKSLPTEAEWERAARGGLEGAEFAWGDAFCPGGRHLANTWQGEFPYENACEDGFSGTSPVGAFPPNGYGLFDLIGNVWEWTDDWFAASHPGAAKKPCCAPLNPRGASRDQSLDPLFPKTPPRKVIKGGSHLCAPNYCQRYRPAARIPQAIDSGTSHLGFRCVKRVSSG